ncbi:hypothetical protein [Mycolicibacterium sp. CR10]|uniref:hypothetical protein n=1 Tax=Mycolicibacterium sp. CR10 TaxID=2562314 RepID=UPI0010BF97A5|nr:hypothetical protein [Mycolicibacterium sp. CR10]
MDATPGDEVVAVGRRQRIRRWLAERRLRQWWKAGVAAILAVAALFGGLDTVDTKVTPFKTGEEFSDGQFAVTIERASLTEQVRGAGRVLGPKTPGRRYLGVVATLRNDGTVPGRLRNELDLRGVPGEEFFGVFRFHDGSSIQTLGPDLTEQLVFIWLVPTDALTPGDTATVRIWKKTYTQLMVAYGGKEWIDSPTDYGLIEVPVGATS